jgi:hypothetical protein
MKALIDNRVSVFHITDWTGQPLEPVLQEYPNSARICQVSETEFPVAEPLFWVDCESFVIADQYWFDTTTDIISEVQNAPKPT